MGKRGSRKLLLPPGDARRKLRVGPRRQQVKRTKATSCEEKDAYFKGTENRREQRMRWLPVRSLLTCGRTWQTSNFRNHRDEAALARTIMTKPKCCYPSYRWRLRRLNFKCLWMSVDVNLNAKWKLTGQVGIFIANSLEFSSDRSIKGLIA